MAALNGHQSSRGRVCGRPIQILQHAPFVRQATGRVEQNLHQVQGKGFNLTGHGGKSGKPTVALPNTATVSQ